MAACRTSAFESGPLYKASLVCLTQGYLAQLVPAGFLDGISVLILDEIQARGESLSYLLAVTKHLVESDDSNLKVVLMGLHGEVELLRNHFKRRVGCVIVSGRRFDVEMFEIVDDRLHWGKSSNIPGYLSHQYEQEASSSRQIQQG